jgi:hypothetical protein
MYKDVFDTITKTWGVSLTSDKSRVILQEITSAGCFFFNYE